MKKENFFKEEHKYFPNTSQARSLHKFSYPYNSHKLQDSAHKKRTIKFISPIGKVCLELSTERYAGTRCCIKDDSKPILHWPLGLYQVNSEIYS